MYNYQSSGTVDNCIFTGNTSKIGGGMQNYDCNSVVIANCIFSGNTSYDKAGGINNNYSGVSVTNCTVTGNTAFDGGGIYNVYYSNVDVTNCIFWNNVVHEIRSDSNTCTLNVNYSDVKGGWSGEVGNIGSDPLFVSAPGDLHLQSSSPCIDTGTASGAPDHDLDGNERPQGSGYDMGAYEH